MKFLIEVEGRTQPDLIHSLDEVRKVLVVGGCYLNVAGCTNAHLRPATEEDEEEFRRQYAAAHPRPAAKWTA